MQTPEKGFYYHYKHAGNDDIYYMAYEILNIAHHTEIEDFDEAAMVVYRPIYEAAKVYQAGKHWDVRPLGMFMEMVTKDGKTFERFQKITDPDLVCSIGMMYDQLLRQCIKAERVITVLMQA